MLSAHGLLKIFSHFVTFERPAKQHSITKHRPQKTTQFKINCHLHLILESHKTLMDAD